MFWSTHSYSGPWRVNHAAATVDGIIFTFGGFNYELSFKQFELIDIHVLDTVKLKWSKLVHEIPDHKCVPFQRSGHSVVAYGTNIYLWGGRNHAKPCNTLFCFDTDALKWSLPKVRGPIPSSRDGHSACIIDHCMYIFGGFQDQPRKFTQDLHMLNLKTMVWSAVKTTGTPPSHRDFHTASSIGNKMYIFGGRGNEFAITDNIKEIYCSEIHYLDTSINKWIQPTIIGNKPPGRHSHSAFVYNGLLHIYGGYNRDMNTHFQDISQYDPENCTWRTILPLGTAPIVRKRQVCIVIKNRVFVSGGSCPILYVPISFERIYDYDIVQPHLEHRDHNDLHILELSPTLKHLSLISSLKFIEEKKLNIKDDLCIPLTLKNELLAVNLLENTNTDNHPPNIIRIIQ